MAFLLTGVNAAVQRLPTGGVAEYLVLLTALHRFGGPSAAAAFLHHSLARRTWTRMAEQSTRMLAKLFPAAKFPTRMSHVAPVVLRILLLAAEAVVLPGYLPGHILTRWTSPTVVRFGTAGPFGRTVQMQNVVAVRTGPNGLGWPDHVTTNETLQFGGIQLPDEFLALRALGDYLRF